MSEFRFESWLWLLGIPVVAALVWFQFQNRRRASAVFSSISDLKSIPVTFMQRVRRLLPWVYGLGLCFMLIGLARPQLGQSESRISGSGIAMELVLDVSGSMEAIDFQLKNEDVNRLTAVKHVVTQFIQGDRRQGLAGRREDLVGVVAFGGFADSKCPLTLDHGAVVDIVKSLEIPKPIRDRQGRVINEDTLKEELATAIGDGVALGVDRLRDANAKSKIMVLLTDGDSNAGSIDPREAAKIAKELGIKIYTIGIGRNGTVPVPQEDSFGRRILVAAQFRVDEELLQEIATLTGGLYFNASDSEGLTKVYAQIDKLEKSEFEGTKYTQYSELFRSCAGIGMGLVLLIHILWETRFRSLP
jgi:Ca-activated chloride channel homolog